MKKKKVALKGLKLDKSHVLNLNADSNGILGGINSIVKGPVDKTIFPTTPNDPTRATFCFFCPPGQSQDPFCINNN